MRTEKELWEVVLSRPDLFDRCLCFWLVDVKFYGLISDDELELLESLLDDEMRKAGKGYFIGPKGQIQARIDWIKNRIEQL